MFSSNKLTDQFIITQNKLGNGAFGSVYVAKIDDKEIAVKCESKENNNYLTLLKEFKICKKIYTIKQKLKYEKQLEIENNPQIDKLLHNLNSNTTIKIYNHISSNNLLSIPEEFNINYLITHECVPNTYSYIECDDFNFLTMDLCGNNFEYLIENYKFTENCKFFITYKLLYTLSCIHRCGIIHRDIKLSNLVLNKKINDNFSDIYPSIIDLGLSKEYYKLEGKKILYINPVNTKNITGTLRYISLNIHEFKSPSIIDDLISLCYTLVVIFTEKKLPWVGHKKDTHKFDQTKHTHKNCQCNYHINKKNNTTIKNNTIAEIKFHTPLEDLVDDHCTFLIKWIKYLYSLNTKQLPSYNFLLKTLKNEYSDIDFLNLKFEIQKN